MSDYKVEVRRDEVDPRLMRIKFEIPVLWVLDYPIDYFVYEPDEWAEDFIVGEPEPITITGAQDDTDKHSATGHHLEQHHHGEV